MEICYTYGMAKHGLEIIDEDIDDLISDENPEKLSRNVQIFLDKQNEFGEFMQDFNKGKIFTKMYQTEDPEFSKKSYYQFWHKLCCNLEKDTNIVCNRKPVRHRVTQISEVAKICNGSNVTITRFINECTGKGLMARFLFKEEKLFVLNPKYVLNGNKMPVMLFRLFNLDEVIEDYDFREAKKVYQEYLRSDRWNETRNKILEMDNFKCVNCDSSDNLQVHHLTYKNIGHEQDKDLITLCKKCHYNLFHDSSRKVFLCNQKTDENFLLGENWEIKISRDNSKPEISLFLSPEAFECLRKENASAAI